MDAMSGGSDIGVPVGMPAPSVIMPASSTIAPPLCSAVGGAPGAALGLRSGNRDGRMSQWYSNRPMISLLVAAVLQLVKLRISHIEMPHVMHW